MMLSEVHHMKQTHTPGTKPKTWRLLHLSVICLLTSGCRLFGGLSIEPVAVSSSTSSQVAVFTSVKDGANPVEGLEPTNFEIEEDGIILDSKQIRLSLLPRDGVVEHHLLLLVDMSGPADDPGTRATVVRQLASFVARMQGHYTVSVYSFDGSQNLANVGTYRRQNNAAAPTLERLTAFQQRDPSSNLHGAMVTALNQLTASLAQSSAPLGLGSLLVVARGPDLAGRTTRDSLLEAINTTPHQVLALTSGFSDPEVADELGPHGHESVASVQSMESELAELGHTLEQDYNRYYLLAYCSPARAGSRSLLVRVHHHDREGKPTEAQAYTEFSAEGFTGKCDPEAMPRFPKERAGRGTMPAAPATEPVASAPSMDPASNMPPPPAPSMSTEEQTIAPPPNSNYAQ
jgi:hypothetical protein